MKQSFLMSVSLLAYVGLGGVANAQDITAETLDKTDEVVATGTRQSLADALVQKRQATDVSEFLSLDDINATPEVTIADAISRLPGVNSTRDRGNISQAMVRGLGPRLTFGLVNGREVASNEPSRNIRWEQYPSELVSGVQLYKSQSANLPAGGVAGTLDLHTISPLDHKGPNGSVRLGAVYNDASADIPDYDGLGYRGSASYVHKFTDDLAVALGGSYQTQKNGSQRTQAWDFAGADGGANAVAGGLDGLGTMAALPWGGQSEVQDIKTNRYSLLGSLEYAPTDNTKIRYDAFFSEFDINEEKPSTWFQSIGDGAWDGSRAGEYSDLVLDDNGFALAGTYNFGSVRNTISRYDQTNGVFNTGLNIEHTQNNWDLGGDVSFSRATRHNNWSAMYLDYNGSVPISWDFTGEPAFDVGAVDTTDLTNLSAVVGGNEGSNLEDELVALRGDVAYNFGDEGLTKISAGVNYVDRTKAVQWFTHDQALSATPVISADVFSSSDSSPFDIPAYLLASSYAEAEAAIYDAATATARANIPTSITDTVADGVSLRDVGNGVAGSWRVDEVTFEAFTQADFEGVTGGLEWNANMGVRFIEIETESFASAIDRSSSVENDTSEFLPSFNLNLMPDDEWVLRFGVARALSKTPLDELRAGTLISAAQSTTTGQPVVASSGNPFLDPFVATQIDLAAEWYFAEEALFGVSVYHKDVESYIGYDTTTLEADPGTGDLETVTINGPVNGEGGQISGLELTFQTPFYFLPGELSNFGIYSNFAFVESNIQEFTPADNPWDLSGLVGNSGTVDLWYSNHGIDARLGYSFSDAYTDNSGWNGASLTGVIAFDSLDLSVSYAINEDLSVRVQGSNLMDNVYETVRRINNPSGYETPFVADAFGRRYAVDLTYTF